MRFRVPFMPALPAADAQGVVRESVGQLCDVRGHGANAAGRFRAGPSSAGATWALYGAGFVSLSTLTNSRKLALHPGTVVLRSAHTVIGE